MPWPLTEHRRAPRHPGSTFAVLESLCRERRQQWATKECQRWRVRHERWCCCVLAPAPGRTEGEGSARSASGAWATHGRRHHDARACLLRHPRPLCCGTNRGKCSRGERESGHTYVAGSSVRMLACGSGCARRTVVDSSDERLLDVLPEQVVRASHVPNTMLEPHVQTELAHLHALRTHSHEARAACQATT